MNARGFFYFLSADAELHDLECALKKRGQVDFAKKIEPIRHLLAKALSTEQDDIYRELELMM